MSRRSFSISRAVVASLLVLLSAGCLGMEFPFELPQPPPPTDLAASFPIAGSRSKKQADHVARRAVQTFRKLVTTENFRQLGFATAQQVHRSRLGMPMAKYTVRLDDLKAYNAGDDPNSLFHRVQRVIYSVRADGKTRSSIELTAARNRWTAAAYGGANRIRALTAVRGATARAEGRNPADYFEVTIPSLNLTFIGNKRNGGFFLTPIARSARFGFVKGGTLPAADVFQAVSAAAQQRDDRPG